MKVRFEIPAERRQVDIDMAEAPAKGEVVYLKKDPADPGVLLNMYVVKHRAWYPQDDLIDVYIVLGK